MQLSSFPKDWFGLYNILADFRWHRDELYKIVLMYLFTHVFLHLAFMTSDTDFLLLFYLELKISFFIHSFQWKGEFITQEYKSTERKQAPLLGSCVKCWSLKKVDTWDTWKPSPSSWNTVIGFVIIMLLQSKYLESVFNGEILQDWSHSQPPRSRAPDWEEVEEAEWRPPSSRGPAVHPLREPLGSCQSHRGRQLLSALKSFLSLVSVLPWESEMIQNLEVNLPCQWDRRFSTTWR